MPRISQCACTSQLTIIIIGFLAPTPTCLGFNSIDTTEGRTDYETRQKESNNRTLHEIVLSERTPAPSDWFDHPYIGDYGERLPEVTAAFEINEETSSNTYHESDPQMFRPNQEDWSTGILQPQSQGHEHLGNDQLEPDYRRFDSAPIPNWLPPPTVESPVVEINHAPHWLPPVPLATVSQYDQLLPPVEENTHRLGSSAVERKQNEHRGTTTEGTTTETTSQPEDATTSTQQEDHTEEYENTTYVSENQAESPDRPTRQPTPDQIEKALMDYYKEQMERRKLTTERQLANNDVDEENKLQSESTTWTSPAADFPTTRAKRNQLLKIQSERRSTVEHRKQEDFAVRDDSGAVGVPDRLQLGPDAVHLNDLEGISTNHLAQVIDNYSWRRQTSAEDKYAVGGGATDDVTPQTVSDTEVLRLINDLNNRYGSPDDKYRHRQFPDVGLPSSTSSPKTSAPGGHWRFGGVPSDSNGARSNGDVTFKVATRHSTFPLCAYDLAAAGRQLNSEYRSDHRHVRTLVECQALCDERESFRCITLAYSPLHSICSLSSIGLQDFIIGHLTNPDHDFDFFTRLECVPSDDRRKHRKEERIQRNLNRDARTVDKETPKKEREAPWMNHVRNETNYRRRAPDPPIQNSSLITFPNTVDYELINSNHELINGKKAPQEERDYEPFVEYASTEGNVDIFESYTTEPSDESSDLLTTAAEPRLQILSRRTSIHNNPPSVAPPLALLSQRNAPTTTKLLEPPPSRPSTPAPPVDVDNHKQPKSWFPNEQKQAVSTSSTAAATQVTDAIPQLTERQGAAEVKQLSSTRPQDRTVLPTQLPSNDATATSVDRARPPHRVANQLPLDAERLLLSAICTPTGVNVTVELPDNGTKYTGAIYAAERFTQCRNVVANTGRFWLFLPRPDLNTVCNTLEVADVMSGVVVISNDNVFPYDITTKSDLFYQVTCDYSKPFVSKSGEEVFVRGGLIVGGPTPLLVPGGVHGVDDGGSTTSDDRLASLRPRPDEIALTMNILRDGRPVDAVLIGEPLTFTIESNQHPSRLKLVNCTVRRIGGPVPAPAPLNIIQEGCSVMPEIIGPVRRTNRGLEAALTAFRIDGSAEIDIQCMVQLCSKACRPQLCWADTTQTSSSEQFGRKRRKKRQSSDHNKRLLPNTTKQHLEAVASRLKVFVQGEAGAPRSNEQSRNALEICLSKLPIIIVSGVLIILTSTAFILPICLFCKCYQCQQFLNSRSNLEETKSDVGDSLWKPNASLVRPCLLYERDQQSEEYRY